VIPDAAGILNYTLTCTSSTATTNAAAIVTVKHLPDE
jgi:hypothetical protein